MESPPPLPSDRGPRDVVAMALVLEAGLAVLALAIGRWLGHWPAPGLMADQSALDLWRAAGWGLAASIPPLIFLAVSASWPWGPLSRLLELVDRLLVPLFQGVSLPGLAAIALAAGLGEEMLFRGLLQDGLAGWWGGPAGPWLGLAVASLAFGLCHSLSRFYALAATLAGAYFGVLLMASGSLLVPIVAHALYDFAALVYLVRLRKLKEEPD